MTLLSRFVAALAFCLALVLPAAAQELTDAQLQGLADRVAAFDVATKANDVAAAMAMVPPKVLDRMATNSGFGVDEFLLFMQEQLDEAMKSIEIVSFGMDFAAAEYAALPGGDTYAMIPTEAVIDLGARYGKVKSITTTLALLEGETWYLVRVDDPTQLLALQQVYPTMAGVAFPAARQEAVTP